MEDAPIWKPVTETLKSAARQLTFQNPMIHISDFSLYDAMSAVELMDPKMDQCYGITASIDDKYQMNVEFPSALSADIIAKTLQCLFVQEVAFLDGASLFESTHQCILLWRESWVYLSERELSPMAKCLTNYCKSLHSSLAAYHRTIMDADIFEDEDFQPINGTMLLEIEDHSTISQELEATRSQSDNPRLSLLLQLRLLLNRLYSCVGRWVSTNMLASTQARRQTATARASSDDVEAESPQSPHELSQEYQRERSRETLGVLQELGDVLDEIKRSKSASSPLFENVGAFQDSPEVGFAFNAALAKLKQANPIRFIHLKPFDSSIGHLIGIVSQLRRVIEHADKWTEEAATLTVEGLLHSTIEVSSEKMHLLARSLFLSLLRVHCVEMDNLVKASLASRGIPHSLVTMDLVQLQWIHVVGAVTQDTFRALTAHRNRLISRLDGVLNSWGVLTQEAGLVDIRFCELEKIPEEKRVQWCSFWVMLMVSTVMDVYLGLTMEMELLSRNEIDYFYWYWDYICSTRLWAQEKLRSLHYEEALKNYLVDLKDYTQERDAAQRKGSGKKKKAAKPLTREMPVEPQKPTITCEELILKAKGQLCRGEFRLAVAGASVDPSLVRKESPFFDWTWRFEQRFRAFSSIVNPPQLNFEDFEKTILTGQNLGVHSIVDNAKVCFENAKLFLTAARRQFPTDEASRLTPSVDASMRRFCLPLTKVAITLSLGVIRSLKAIGEPSDATTADPKKCVVRISDNNASFPVIEIAQL